MIRDLRKALAYPPAMAPMGVIAKATADLGRNAAAAAETPVQKLLGACKALAIPTTVGGGPPLPAAAGLGLLAPVKKIDPVDADFFSRKIGVSSSTADKLAQEYKGCDKTAFWDFFVFIKQHKSDNTAIKMAGEFSRAGCDPKAFSNFWKHI